MTQKIKRKKQPPRQENTTALIPHFNEPFIRESVLSIAPLVEEVIVADSGSNDRYLDWLYSAAASAGNVRIHHLDMREQPYLQKMRNFLQEKARTEWVLLYDSDQIAYAKGDRCILSLYDRLTDFPDHDYFSLAYPCIAGDSKHYQPGKQSHPPRIVLNRNGTVDYLINKSIDDINIDLDEAINVSGHYWIATDLKPIERLAFRGMMGKFVRENPDPVNLPTLWEWMHYYQSGEYPSSQQQVLETKLANLRWQHDKVLDFKPFDFEKWGPHPKLLRESEMLKEFVLTEVEGGYNRSRYPLRY